MKKSVKEHFVPQHYLNRFINEKEQLEVYDKITGKYYTSSTTDVCCKKDYFTPETAKENFKQGESIEQETAKLDSEYNDTLFKFLEAINSNVNINTELRTKISWFIIFQYLRSPNIRRINTEFRREINQFIQENHPDSKTKVKTDKDSEKINHTFLSFNPNLIEILSKRLFEYIWIFGVLPNKKYAYTSDRPVHLYSHKNMGPFGITIGNPGTEVIFPLTKSLILCAYERSHFLSLEKYDCKKSDLTEQNILFYNSIQILRCQRQLLCNVLERKFINEVIQKQK
ncbi:DUF4238 domain-containing protein [Leptospira yanagawae]|uniref:DUF4238 domain-containing protein n=1 Tax=Leptospira yanagawae TaxID=293069 RepID=A0ABY2M767_9LEPT|nr:DUF4238 domain-containing protein [Leptospira yanagawae]TGL23061.1 DUF4238 domain-containing protein [Leptospira yanagawae]